jgi:hypothetical protein
MASAELVDDGKQSSAGESGGQHAAAPAGKH